MNPWSARAGTTIVIASHSGYGHTAQIATAVADGAGSVAGTQVHRVDVAFLSGRLGADGRGQGEVLRPQRGRTREAPQGARRAAGLRPADRVLPVRTGRRAALPVLDELGIGFVAYSPLGRGFITGTTKPAGQYEATDMRNVDPRWQPGNFEKNVEAVDRLAELAAAKDATVTHLDLRLPETDAALGQDFRTREEDDQQIEPLPRL